MELNSQRRLFKSITTGKRDWTYLPKAKGKKSFKVLRQTTEKVLKTLGTKLTKWLDHVGC
jgi:peptidase E